MTQDTNRDLFNAMSDDNAEGVERALQAGASLELRTEIGGRTPLIYSAFSNKTDVFVHLLNKGADVHALDDIGSTALTYAAAHGNNAMIEMLIARDADLDICTSGGHGALLVAAYNGHDHVVSALLKAGAAMEIKGGVNQRTALHIAAEKGHLGVAAILIKAGADRLARDHEGNTPYDVALAHKHLAVGEMLRRGATSPVQLLSENEVEVPFEPGSASTEKFRAAVLAAREYAAPDGEDFSRTH